MAELIQDKIVCSDCFPDFALWTVKVEGLRINFTELRFQRKFKGKLFYAK